VIAACELALALAEGDIKRAEYWQRIKSLNDRSPALEPEYAAQLRSIFAPVRKPAP